MKTKSLLFFVALFSALSLRAAEVNFRNITWDAARQAAAAEHKYIFVDGFTEWCHWCKVLDQKTFPDSAVAEFMNNNFVSLKLDMERDFGRVMSMKYRVTAYPTQLVFDAAGKLVYVNVGYSPTPDFLVMLHNAVDRKSQSTFTGISDKIELDFPDFYKASFGPNGKRKAADSLVVNNYLDQQKDLTSEINWSVMSRFPLFPKYNQFVIDHSAQLAAMYGKAGVSQKLGNIFYKQTMVAAANKDDAAFAVIKRNAEKYSLDPDPSMIASLSRTYFQASGNWKGYAAACEEMLAKNNFSDADQINGCAWPIYENCTDGDVIAMAIAWMRKAVAVSQSYEVLDTYAALLYKSGDSKEAERYALLAIDAGKKNKSDVSSTEKLLEKIRGVKTP